MSPPPVSAPSCSSSLRAGAISTNDQPTYHDIDFDLNGAQQHCNNNSTAIAPPLVTNSQLTSDNIITPVDELVASRIDPPKGFELTSTDVDSEAAADLDSAAPSNAGTCTLTDLRVLSQSTSQNTSSTTSLSSDELTNYLSERQQISTDKHLAADNDIPNHVHTQLNNNSPSSLNGTYFDPNIPSCSSQQQQTTTPQQTTTAFKSVDPQPSTSSHRLFTGINCIVSRVRALANTSLSIINTDRCFQDDVPKFAFAHKKTLERTWKLMDKVVKWCQRPQMNLNNSPPFILEILPETYQLLKLIHTKTHNGSNNESSLSAAHGNEYSQIFLRNLQNRCKQTLKLFKDNKEEMYNEKSEGRQKLTRHTLIFNHILSELKAIFPAGSFIGEKYLITKKETAGEFWRTSFGYSVIVEWKAFYHALMRVHNIDSSFFSLNALKQTIDLICDDYISIFEFDVFTRLFQPWSTLLRNWQVLAIRHPGYQAFLTYDELKARLQNHIYLPGSYLFRLSCTRLGQWAIGYVTPDGQILQTIVQNISLSQALTDTKIYMYPDGKVRDPQLINMCSEIVGDENKVVVTEDEYELYCSVASSCQSCKICFDNDKDIQLEPCQHLLCSSCLIGWQESEGQGCPFCRTEIKETRQITIDLPRSTK